jgi:hypothetical protein
MLAQVSVSPNATATINTGGWVYGMAVALVVLGVVVTLLIVFGYLRFAPRFQREEGRTRSVKAPRLEPGKEVRRPVKITGAPVMAPAPIATATGAAPATVASPAPAAAAAAAPAPAPAPAVAPAPAAPPAAAPALAAPPAAASAPAAPPAAAPAPVPTEHVEVAPDQETYEKTLAELLGKGTDRRVAEGQAKRAAMIAARKKAAG